MDIAVLAGMISTAVFAGSSLPMLVKAFRTRDLGSYSLGNLVLANAGNAVHAIYVFSLPAGPVWILHTFNELVAAFMLAWYLRFERWPRRGHTPVAAHLAEHDERLFPPATVPAGVAAPHWSAAPLPRAA